MSQKTAEKLVINYLETTGRKVVAKTLQQEAKLTDLKPQFRNDLIHRLFKVLNNAYTPQTYIEDYRELK